MKLISVISLIFFSLLADGAVKIRFFSDSRPEMAFFTVISGKYDADLYSGERISIGKGETVLISRYNGRLVIKARNHRAYPADSINFKGITGTDQFSVRTNSGLPVRQIYPGDLNCRNDLGTIVLINTSSVEDYIAGVVQAEGGIGKNIEYFKTQAVIVRTYMHKYSGKHIQDGYDLCDNTHCQAYNGKCTDPSISRAVHETNALVILDSDSALIISAFHSNCGGETSPSEDVWLTSIPYLRKVDDPHCSSARNAQWQKKVSPQEWISLLTRAGFKGNTNDLSIFRFANSTRAANYTA